MLELFTTTALVFYLLGILSMLTHAIKKWVAGEIRGNVVDWYWSHPRASVGALIACVSSVTVGILTGTFTDYTVGEQVLVAWGAGYIADTFNAQGKKT